MLMYGLQWWIVSIPCVVIIGIIVARLHYTDQVEQIFYYAEAVRNHGIGYDCPDVVGTSAAFSHRTGFGVTDRDSFDGFDRGRRYL